MSQNSDWDIVDLNKDIPKKVSQKILSKIKVVEDKIDNIEKMNLKIIDQNNKLITLLESQNSNKGLKCLLNNKKNNQPDMFINRLTNTAWRQNYITTPNLSISNLNYLNDNINEKNDIDEKNDINEKNDMNDID